MAKQIFFGSGRVVHLMGQNNQCWALAHSKLKPCKLVCGANFVSRLFIGSSFVSVYANLLTQQRLEHALQMRMCVRDNQRGSREELDSLCCCHSQTWLCLVWVAKFNFAQNCARSPGAGWFTLPVGQVNLSYGDGGSSSSSCIKRLYALNF